MSVSVIIPAYNEAVRLPTTLAATADYFAARGEAFEILVIDDGSMDGTARLWDVQTGQELRRFAGYTGAVVAVAFSPDGKSVLLGSYDYTAQRSDIDYQGLIQAACARVLRDFTDDERLQFEISGTQ